MAQTECQKCSRLIRNNNYSRHVASCDGTLFYGPSNPSKRLRKPSDEVRRTRVENAARARDALREKYDGSHPSRGRKIVPDEMIFVKGVEPMTAWARDRYLLTVSDYKCARCGNAGEWNGDPLVLQVDHIDGDRTNNVLDNLRLLCPNCHSQTPTFCRASGNTYVSDADFIAALRTYPTTRQAILSLGLLDAGSHYRKAQRFRRMGFVD